MKSHLLLIVGVLLLSLCLTLGMIAQADEWAAILTATSDNPSVEVQTLTFKTVQGATDGYDYLPIAGVEVQTPDVVGNQVTETNQLQPGWNMISIPGIPVNTDSLSLIGNSQTIVPIVYSWNPERFTYTPINELQVGQAYWILTLSPEGEDVTLLIEPLASLSLELKPGWNMIGGLQQSVTIVYGSENPSGSIVPQTLYSWNASMFTYQPQTILESNKRGTGCSPFSHARSI